MGAVRERELSVASPEVIERRLLNLSSLLLNHLHPNISMHTLLSDPYIFSRVLKREFV